MSKKRSYTKSSKPLSLHSNRFTLELVLVALVSGFLLIAPFSRALFNGGSITFEGPIYRALLFGAILLLLLAVYLYKHFDPKEISGAIAIVIWLLPVTFLISYFTAVSPHAANNGILIHMLYAVFFIAALYLGQKRPYKEYLLYGLLCAGYTLVVFGFMNWFGDASLWGLIRYIDTITVYKDAVMLTDIGVRLTSVFQYANTYAAFLIGLYAATLILLTHSKRWLTSMLFGLWLVPILLSLVLTLSRGGYLVWPIVIALLLPLLGLSKQLTAIIHLLVSGAGTLLLLKPISRIGSDALDAANSGDILTGWLLLAAVSIIASALAVAVQRYVKPWLTNKLQVVEQRRLLNRFGLFSAFVILGGIGLYLLLGTNAAQLLPASIGDRISNINLQQHSVLERITLYADAMKIIADYPITGTGSGGWSAIYMQYQNNPYLVAQAHNFLLQYIIETGLLGFTVFILIAGYIVIRFLIKQQHDDEDDVPTVAFFAFLVGLGIHSIIDFNLSYVYLGIVFFLCLGIVASTLEGASGFLSKPQLSRLKIIYPTFVAIVAIIFVVMSFQKTSAYQQYRQAIADAPKGVPFSLIEQNLKDAMQKDPTNPIYKLQLATFYTSIYEQENDQQYLLKAKELVDLTVDQEPYNLTALLLKGRIMQIEQDWSALVEHFESMIQKYPWEISHYESAITIHYELGQQAKESGNEELMQQHWNRIHDLVAVIEAKVEHLSTLPEGQIQGRPFEITTDIRAVFEAIKSATN